MPSPTKPPAPASPDPLHEATLVKQAKAGELAAFEALMALHEQRVFALAWRITRHEQDAEDVTQQAFLSALEHLQSFREDARFGTWIHRIATHAALKILRKRRGLETEPLSEDPALDEDFHGIQKPSYIAVWNRSPDELAHLEETRHLIEDALRSLPEKHRLVFVLRDIQGLSVRETAEALGISEVNVKVRLLRARLQLRETLTHAFGDPASAVAPGHAHPAAVHPAGEPV